MDVVRLKEDVIMALEENIETIALSEEEAVMSGFEISTDRPAVSIAVPGGWQIIILNTLTPTEQLQILSHELGHLLLKGEGLFEVKLGEEWSENYLAQRMNSVIFHHLLIDRLARDYQIGNEYPLSLLKGILQQGEEFISEYADEPLVLTGIGLQLLDLIINTDGHEERIRELLTLSERAQQAFESGEEFLIYPA